MSEDNLRCVLKYMERRDYYRSDKYYFKRRFSNNAASHAVRSDSSDSFKNHMRAQSKDSKAVYQQKSNSKSHDFYKFHVLSKDEDGKMVNIKAKLSSLGGEEEQQDSMCCDSELMKLLDGIVGILEGFGLLDYTRMRTLKII